MTWSLRRWWRDLFRAKERAPAPVEPEPGARRASGAGGDWADDASGDAVRRPPVPRRYTPTVRADDPQREAHLGAVLQALAAGPLGRGELGRRVGADEWGPGRLDDVVDHGLSTGVLLPADGDGVRARYAD